MVSKVFRINQLQPEEDNDPLFMMGELLPGNLLFLQEVYRQSMVQQLTCNQVFPAHFPIIVPASNCLFFPGNQFPLTALFRDLF